MAALLLELWARIPPGAWMSVCCECRVCCQVEVSATSWSLIQRSPTDCSALLCVIQKPCEWGGPAPLGAVASKTNATLEDVCDQDAVSEKFQPHNLCTELQATACTILRFLDHTLSALGRTPPDEWSARRRDLYLTHNLRNRQTSMPPGGIRTHKLSKRAAADPRLRPRGQWERRPLSSLLRICYDAVSLGNRFPAILRFVVHSSRKSRVLRTYYPIAQCDIRPTLVLRPRYVPEKVSVNQKEVK